MKRTCDGCRALNTIFEPKCDLGFKILANKQYCGINIGWKPLEECPKPKTIKDYFYLRSMKMYGKPI